MVDLALTGEAHGVPLQYVSIERFLQNPQGNPKEYEEQVSPYLCTTSS